MPEPTPLLQVRVRQSLREAIRKHAQAHPEVTFREIMEEALEEYLLARGEPATATSPRPVRLVPGRRRRFRRVQSDLICIIDDLSEGDSPASEPASPLSEGEIAA